MSASASSVSPRPDLSSSRPTARASQACVLYAFGRERVECLLEARRLRDAGLDDVLVGIQRAVEHHGADPVGEGLGVGGTDPGAVGIAEIAELVVTERATDDVHIAHHFP